MSDSVFQFKIHDAVYTPDGRGIIIEAKNFNNENRYLVRLVKILDFLESSEVEHVYHESDLSPAGDCEDCVPLDENFDVGEKID